MDDIDVQSYVLPALLTLLILGTFLVIVTSGGGEDSEAVNRPARFPATTTSTTKARTSTTGRPRTTTTQTIPAASGRFVKVQPGDTPSSIADRSGISTERLLELNPSVDPTALKPGQNLKLVP